ncbi:MAG: MATE family efflux transporter [Thermoguttaceae bacterium]|nr:MATE family efflux transporter [Thermoguttaceae bacterium]
MNGTHTSDHAAGYWHRWWNKQAGGKEVFHLALPMIISSGSFALMQFADRVFLTWYNPGAMAAAFSAGQLLWLFASFPFSIMAYTNAFVSQYNGARQFRKIGSIIWQGLFLVVLISPLYLLLMPWLDELFGLWHEKAVVKMESDYLFWLLWGVTPMLGNEVLSSFFSGRKRTRTVMLVNVSAIALNIVLDYVMIFGWRAIPSMGLTGAAIATTISQWLRFGLFFFLTWRVDRRSKGRYHFIRGCRVNFSQQRLMLKFGGMGGVQFSIEMAITAIFILLLGMVGTDAAASSAIAFNLNSLTFLPILGLGNAATTLVGNYIGRGQTHLARRSTRTSLTIGLFFTTIFMILYFFFPHLLLAAYFRGNAESIASLNTLTTILLKFVAVYLLFDTGSMIFASALRGAGDTGFLLLVSIISIPFFTVIPWIGIHYFQLGIYWCWSIMTGFICVSSVIFLLRILLSRWEKSFVQADGAANS